MKTLPFLLSGQWIETPVLLPLQSPWPLHYLKDQTPLASFVAGPDHARQSAQAAREVLPAMRAMSRFKRAEALRKIAAEIAAGSDALSQSICMEAGKPLTLARAEVQRAAGVFQIAADEALRPPGALIHPDREAHGAGLTGRVDYFPIGPVLGITPFNFPLNLVAHKVAPALAAGCPIVIKPPPQAPSAALALGRIVLQSGFPLAALQVLTGGFELGQALCSCDEFAALSFTGSAKAGWAIKRNALPRQKVLLELGGNAAVIVDKSADLSAAVHAVATAGYAYAGQICISTQRVFVDRSVADEFERRLAERILRNVPVSDNPADADTLVGPLIDSAAADRIDQWLALAEAAGARVLIRGQRRSVNLISPWLLEAVPDNQPLACEEVFGPVVTLDAVKNLDEAIARANASKYGLQTSIFTSSMSSAEQAFRELECGAVLVNLPTTFRLDSQLYGGIKDSGFGREGIAEVIREFSQPKLLVAKS